MKLDSRFPFYLFLLPIFFSLHVLTEIFIPSLVEESIFITLLYILYGILIASLSWLLFKDVTKAALLAFSILSYNFFFGSSYDFIKKYFSTSFICRFSFILPASLIVFLLLILYLKKTKKSFNRLNQYLNLLLLLLILNEIIIIIPKLAEKKKPAVTDLSNNLIPCDTCSKPDVYLIVADEYAGKMELTEILNFDNSAFENQLKVRGFHVVSDTKSNYSATVYSMASFFNMDYISNLTSKKVTHLDMLRCQQLIRINNTISFFKKNDYSIYNHSYFSIDKKKKAVYNPFYPTKKALFTAQTFTQRFNRAVGYNFASAKKIEKLKKHHYYNNKILDSLLRATVSKKDGPKFVYTHLAIPHHPYYFDGNGKETPVEMLTDSFTMNKGAYIEYLQYCNRQLLDLIDLIQKSSATPPVIILISDHGFRQLPSDVSINYLFMNLNAVFLPNKNYSKFYDGMTNVNQFRVILNAQFGQRLPLLKDSTIYIPEKR